MDDLKKSNGGDFTHKMTTIISATNGSIVPSNEVSTPLMRFGQILKNGHGKTVMNNSWIYVNDGFGCYSINVYRSEYCRINALAKIKILDSITLRPTNNLKKFISEVSDSLIFEKDNIKFQVFLKKNGSFIDIDCIKPAYFKSSLACNRCLDRLPKIYQSLPFYSTCSYFKDSINKTIANDLGVSLDYFQTKK